MASLVKEAGSVTTDSEIDSAELAQRVAILKRFKTLLSQQRDRFSSYLNLLDKQQSIIESGSAEDLLTYVEIEEKIVADIFSIQKVIDPLEEMYYTVISSNNIPGKAHAESRDEVGGLKASLEKLKSEAVIRSTKNKELLSKRCWNFALKLKPCGTIPTPQTRAAQVSATQTLPHLLTLRGNFGVG